MQAERAHEHTRSPTPQPGVAGRSRNLSPSTHTQAAHPSQERRGTGGARTPAHTHPNTPARSGGAQPKSEPKHTHPHRTPEQGVAGYKGGTHKSTHTPQQPSQEWWGAAETRAQTHTPKARTPARSGGVQAERPHQHTQSPTPQPEVAGCSRNPSPNTHTHGTHPSQEWRAASGAPTQAHARNGGVQPKPEPKHTHPRCAPKTGVAGCKRSAHTSTHLEWRGAAETRAQKHSPTARTQARSGGVQAERPHQHTPGVVGCSRKPSPNTHTQGAHPSQEWRDASGAPRQHTHSPTPGPGGAQPKPEPKHTHPRRAPRPGVAGCKQSAHTSTRQEWRGAAETRAQTHTPTARTQARVGGVQAERLHQHTPGVAGCSRDASPNTHTHGGHPSQERWAASGAPTPAHARSGGVQPKPEPKHDHHRRAPKPGVAGCKRSAHTSTRQEWRGAAETRAQTHTPKPHNPAKSGGVQAERPHQHTPGVAGCSRNPSPKTHTHGAHPSQEGGVQAEHTHSPTPQPGVAGCSRNLSPNTHTHGAHPSQEWRGASGAPTPAHTQPNTPARSGGAQPKPEPKHTHPRRAP